MVTALSTASPVFSALTTPSAGGGGSSRTKRLEAEHAQMARLQDLERVDHPHRGGQHDQAGGADEQRVAEVPVAVRARRHEAREDRERREQRRPQVQVRRGAPLREADPQEAVVEVVVVGAPGRAAGT